MEKFPTTSMQPERRVESRTVQRVTQPSLYVLLSEFVLWLATISERKSSARTLRKAIIMRRWMEISGNILANSILPGVQSS